MRVQTAGSVYLDSFFPAGIGGAPQRTSSPDMEGTVSLWQRVHLMTENLIKPIWDYESLRMAQQENDVLDKLINNPLQEKPDPSILQIIEKCLLDDNDQMWYRSDDKKYQPVLSVPRAWYRNSCL